MIGSIEVAAAPAEATGAAGVGAGAVIVDRLLERRPSPAEVQEATESKGKGITDPQETLKGIPKKYAAKIELAVEALLGAVAPDAEVNILSEYDIF